MSTTQDPVFDGMHNDSIKTAMTPTFGDATSTRTAPALAATSLDSKTTTTLTGTTAAACC